MAQFNTVGSQPEHKEHSFVARGIWCISFPIGTITFVLAIMGTPFNDGLQGIATTLTLSVPLFIGFPAALYSVIYAIIFRLKQQRLLSAMLLLAHVLLFALNFWIGAMTCC